MRSLLALLTFSLLFFVPTSSEAATLRCGNKLASDGDSQADVLAKCGSPSFTHHRTQKDKAKTGYRQQGQTGGKTTEYEQTVTKDIEEWTYDFGPNRLVQTAVFEDGKLVDVRSGGYGH